MKNRFNPIGYAVIAETVQNIFLISEVRNGDLWLAEAPRNAVAPTKSDATRKKALGNTELPTINPRSALQKHGSKQHNLYSWVGKMFADTPSVCPFTFAIHDLSGNRVGPIWERFVHCLPTSDEMLDLDDLLAQAEMMLDCAAHLDNYTRKAEIVWSSGFYITHMISEWGADKKPAVLRAYPSLPGRLPPQAPGVGVARPPVSAGAEPA